MIGPDISAEADVKEDLVAFSVKYKPIPAGVDVSLAQSLTEIRTYLQADSIFFFGASVHIRKSKESASSDAHLDSDDANTALVFHYPTTQEAQLRVAIILILSWDFQRQRGIEARTKRIILARFV